MAIFGNLETIKQQLSQACFQVAFHYLDSIGNNFLTLQNNESIKEYISKEIFVLKQSYNTKARENAFFESHQKYIDIQYVVEGEEYMDVSCIENLTLFEPYNSEKDAAKYHTLKENFSSLLIQKGQLAIFFPQDAHQPCIQNHTSKRVFKAVIKIPVELF
jgi:YhcH/YjgK/YiaL family protein